MSRCRRCGAEYGLSEPVTVPLRALPTVLVSGITGQTCSGCGDLKYGVPNMEDLFRVIAGFFFGDGSAFASRWDGTAWTPVTLPASVGAGRTLFKTDAYDDGYVVVGNRGLSLFVDDSGASAPSAC